MKKIIDSLLKDSSDVFFIIANISLSLIFTDDAIIRNPHSPLYYIGGIVFYVGVFFHFYSRYVKDKFTYWYIVYDCIERDTFQNKEFNLCHTMTRRQKGEILDKKDVLEFISKRYENAWIVDYIRISKHEFETKYNVLKMM